MSVRASSDIVLSLVNSIDGQRFDNEWLVPTLEKYFTEDVIQCMDRVDYFQLMLNEDLIKIRTFFALKPSQNELTIINRKVERAIQEKLEVSRDVGIVKHRNVVAAMLEDFGETIDQDQSNIENLFIEKLHKMNDQNSKLSSLLDGMLRKDQ